MRNPDKTDNKQKSTRFKPGQSGNPKGRPQGSRHKSTLAALVLLEGQVEQLTQKCIDAALEGDTVAMRLCLERLVPTAKDRTIRLDLPSTATIEGVGQAFDVVMVALAEGEVAPSEASTIAAILEKRRVAIETRDLEERIRALEEKSLP